MLYLLFNVEMLPLNVALRLSFNASVIETEGKRFAFYSHENVKNKGQWKHVSTMPSTSLLITFKRHLMVVL